MTIRDERTEHRRDRLFARTWALLTRAPDVTWASCTDYTFHTNLPRLVIELPGPGAREPHADFRLDRAQGVIFYRLPHGSGLKAMPLTAEREALLEDLRREYGAAEQWSEAFGIAEEAAEMLMGMGWTAHDYHEWNRVMRTQSADDARAVLSRTGQQWQNAGWGPLQRSYGEEYIPGGTPTAVEAAALADRGLTRTMVKSLRETGGYRTLADLLDARPPEIPADATRVLLTSTDPWDRTNVQFTASEPATRWLARKPKLWRQDTVDAAAGPRPALIASRHAEWVLWDDGRLVHGNLLTGLNEWGGQQGARDGDFTDVPRASEAATRAVRLLAKSITSQTALAEAAAPLLTATNCRKTREAEHDPDRSRGAGTTIIRSRYTFHDADGSELGSLWEINIIDWERGIDALETRRIARTAAQADEVFDQAVRATTPTPPTPRRVGETDRKCPGRDVEHCDHCGATSPKPNDFTGDLLGFMAASLGTACGITCYDAMADQPGAHAVRCHH